MKANNEIDEIDKTILMYLIENTRLPFTEIAKNEYFCRYYSCESQKLEEAGVIRGTTLITDYDKMGYQFVAYLGILLTKTNKIQNVMEELYKIQMLP